jgi:uncharacterized protein (DUF305 family)
MRAHCLICSIVLFACTASEEGTPVVESPDEAQQAVDSLKTRHREDDGGRCRGRYYWTCKEARTPHIPKSDVELIDTLVPHHEAAVKMATMEIERGADAEVKAMAEMMKADQLEEIATLREIREELSGCDRVKPFPDPHMDRDMAEMMGLAGLALDKAFLEHMIPHHAGAVQFTHNALPNLQHPELEALAHHVIDVQAMEIGEMQAKKEQL